MKLISALKQDCEAWSELPLGFVFAVVAAVIVCEMAVGLLPMDLTLEMQLLLLRLSELLLMGLLISRFSQFDSLGLIRPGITELRLFLLFSLFTLLAFGLLLLISLLAGFPLLNYLAGPPWVTGLSGIMVMLVLAPVVEEIIFRGLIYRLLRQSFGVSLSVVSSALCFALMHGQLALPQIFGGLVFALAYEWSRNLWLAMVLHACGNAAILLLLLF